MSNVLWCRVFQFGLKLGNYVIPYRTPHMLKGPGAVRKLPAKIKEQGVKNVFIVCGPHIRTSGLLDGLLAALEEQDIAYTIFSDLQANPTDENVEAGLTLLKESGCKGIIAFGGGSPMDCAKAIAARHARPHKTVAELQGVLKVRRKILPLWAVPTTAGTGSETTVASVIMEQATMHKASINDPSIMPRWAVLDPELLVSVPPKTTAATGMDAFCHAVEAYTNWRFCTKTEKSMALQAVRLIHSNIYQACANGADLEAREGMQLGAFYAGRAFTRGCVGNVHACGHPLSALYDLSHGLVMATLLPKVLRQYGKKVYKRLSELADSCGIGGYTKEEKALNLIAWIEKANADLGLPERIEQIRAGDIPQMIAWADQEANPLYPVPVVWKEEDFRALYDSVRIIGEDEEIAQAAAEPAEKTKRKLSVPKIKKTPKAEAEEPAPETAAEETEEDQPKEKRKLSLPKLKKSAKAEDTEDSAEPPAEESDEKPSKKKLKLPKVKVPNVKMPKLGRKAEEESEEPELVEAEVISEEETKDIPAAEVAAVEISETPVVEMPIAEPETPTESIVEEPAEEVVEATMEEPIAEPEPPVVEAVVESIPEPVAETPAEAPAEEPAEESIAEEPVAEEPATE